tara:strand:+ start:887 stop:1462 length:576 start_codon:yes stop_codon:yes gene_type:complete
MSCSKIRQHLEAAEEEIRQALTASLKNKHEENLTLLVDTLNNVKELLITTPIRGTDNTTEYYKKNAEHNFKLESPYMDDNVINFPTSIPGMDVDTSNLSFDFSDTACTNSTSYTVGDGITGNVDLDLLSTDGDIHIKGAMADDTITFNAEGLISNVPTIKIDTRVGGDLDKLDEVVDKNKHAQDLNDRDGE